MDPRQTFNDKRTAGKGCSRPKRPDLDANVFEQELLLS